MESQTSYLQIPCPLHPSEKIQKVVMNQNVDHHISCSECILQQKSQPGGVSQVLKPISELIETAASLYTKKRENVKFEERIPYEFEDIVSDQAEKMETFTQHIEEEKKRVSSLFDSISEELLKIIREKETEALYKLDQQIFNLGFWYISFNKQLKKTYPTLEDVPVLYPTKEDLFSKLSKITNVTQLTAFVRSIKDDLNETTGPLTDNERELELKKKAAIHTLSKQLLQITKLRPSYQKENFNLQKLKKDLREKVASLMKQTWDIQNPIPEVTTGYTAASAFLKPKDFTLIKSWLPQSLTFSPQLLFRGSRDGMDGPSFHKFCDGKENTITVIKVKFQHARTVSILGGFLDKPWNSCGKFIHSENSFIFSLTEHLKCSLTKDGAQYAASGNPDQGPCFGSGYDIGVWTEGPMSFVSPSSYKDSYYLIESSFGSRGKHLMAMMDVFDIEVYSVN